MIASNKRFLVQLDETRARSLNFNPNTGLARPLPSTGTLTLASTSPLNSVPGLASMQPSFTVQPYTAAQTRPPDAISMFTEKNGLDVAAGNALRALPLDVQQDVMAEGAVRGRNPSAILMARIRQVQSMRRG